MGVVEEVMIIKDKKKWSHSLEFDEEIRRWLTFVISLVDIVDASANECLKQLFSEYQCCGKHHDFIRQEVSFESTILINSFVSHTDT